MLLVLSVRLAATIHYYLQAFAPTNILLRHLRTPGGLKLAIPAALVLVPVYLFTAAITTTVIDDGAPGWLNLVVLICIWNAIRVVCIGVLSPILLIASALRGTRLTHAYAFACHVCRGALPLTEPKGSGGRLPNRCSPSRTPVAEVQAQGGS